MGALTCPGRASRPVDGPVGPRRSGYPSWTSSILGEHSGHEPVPAPEVTRYSVILLPPHPVNHPATSTITSVEPAALYMPRSPVAPSSATTRLGAVSPGIQLRSLASGWVVPPG